MKIAIVGIRGIPANYGGFETFAEELAPRLAEMGYDVTVYGRTNNIDRRYDGTLYKGVRIKLLPTISHKYLDTVAHTFLAALHTVFQGYDAILYCNAANSPFTIISRLAGSKVAINVDGIERLRKKWNILGRVYYRVGEYLSTKFPNRIVSDAQVIKDYYLETYRADSTLIAYGADTKRLETTEALDRIGVKPRGYVLYVSRLEPENNAHVVIQAFRKVVTDKKLVVVGDAPYSEEYKRRLRELAEGDERIIFTGYVFGSGYKEFQCHAFCYVQATEVGGTHPALIESMGFGNYVLVNDTPENREVVADAAVLFRRNDPEDLAAKLQEVIDSPEIIPGYREKALARVAEKYSWDAIAAQYDDLFRQLTGGQ